MNSEKIIKDLSDNINGVITLEDKQPINGVLIPNIEDKPMMVLVDSKETKVYINLNTDNISEEVYLEMINTVSNVIKDKING